MVVGEREAGAPAGVLDRSRRALTLGLIVVVSLVAFEALAVATVLPAAVREIGGLRLYGWAFSAFMLASLVSTIAAGRYADLRGPALPFLGGVVLFGCGLIVAGLAPSMLIFIGGRALQGGGAGAVGTTAYVSISRGYPDALRARMFALLLSAWVMPALIGPAVAGVLAERASWRLVFLGLLPLLVLAGTVALIALRRLAITEQPDTAGGGRLWPALRLAVGTGVLLAGLDLEQPLLVGAAIVLGLALAGPALVRLLPAGTPTLRVGLPAGIAVNALLNFGYFGAEAFTPLGLTAGRGLSTGAAGLTLTAAALTWTAGSWLQARLDARDGGRGRRGRVSAGFVFVVSGVAIVALTVVSEQAPILLAWVGAAIGGLGMGLAYSTISLIVLAQAPSGQEGAVASSLRVAELLSIAVSAGLGGAVIALGERIGWAEHAGIGVAFAVALTGALAGGFASRRLPSGRV